MDWASRRMRSTRVTGGILRRGAMVGGWKWARRTESRAEAVEEDLAKVGVAAVAPLGESAVLGELRCH